MSKKRVKMLAWAVAAVLAFMPLLYGCTGGNPSGAADQAASEQQKAGPAPQVMRYGKVTAINGDEVSVSLGTLGDAKDSGKPKEFQADGGTITFNRSGVSVVNESGAIVESSEFSAGDLLVMQGSGDGSGFKPSAVEILSADGSGAPAQN